MAFKESDHPRNKIGEFSDVPGVEPVKVNKNASFFAKLSAKVGATDDKATAKAKVAAAGKAWDAKSPKKSGAFGAVKVAQKAAPAKAAPVTMKVAGPATLPKKAAPAAPEKPRQYSKVTAAQAAAMQAKMLKDRPWTPGERGALRTYTGEKYTAINGALRKGGGSAATKSTIARARAGMRETPKDVAVFRGMGSGSAFGFVKNRKITTAQLDALVGKTWSDPGFTSTSIKEGRYGAGQRIQAKISVPAGTRGAFVEGITQNKTEDEFVLDAGTHFKITRYERAADGQVTLYMEVASQDA